MLGLVLIFCCTAQKQDYECALEITKNIRRLLKSVRYVGRYNGTRRAIMGACCVGKNIERTAALLVQ